MTDIELYLNEIAENPEEDMDDVFAEADEMVSFSDTLQCFVQ